MYRQCSCLYRYSAYIGTYSDPYTSIGATLVIIVIISDDIMMYTTSHTTLTSQVSQTYFNYYCNN